MLKRINYIESIKDSNSVYKCNRCFAIYEEIIFGSKQNGRDVKRCYGCGATMQKIDIDKDLLERYNALSRSLTITNGIVTMCNELLDKESD